ncbi:MAG: M14-type cytosolic carboxypeptidase [Enterobacterales bacterium]|nr:M14-type cytosolic carboxypeptidase [Enterobacterales bacterium]
MFVVWIQAIQRQVKPHIEKDNPKQFFQWLYFRASGVANSKWSTLSSTNTSLMAKLIRTAGRAITAVASAGPTEDWFRVPTSYQDGVVRHQS